MATNVPGGNVMLIFSAKKFAVTNVMYDAIFEKKFLNKNANFLPKIWRKLF
jgi:hypothetical protein